MAEMDAAMLSGVIDRRFWPEENRPPGARTQGKMYFCRNGDAE